MMRAAVLLGLSAAFSACQPSERLRADWNAIQQSREAQLAGAGEFWRRAYAAGNWDALRALYADDAVLMTQGSDRIEGADNIVAFLQRLSNAGGTAQFQFANEEVMMGSGGETGFVTAKYRMDIVFPGQEPSVIAGRSFLVYKWEDDGWKLWRDIDNLAPDVMPEDFE